MFDFLDNLNSALDSTFEFVGDLASSPLGELAGNLGFLDFLQPDGSGGGGAPAPAAAGAVAAAAPRYSPSPYFPQLQAPGPGSGMSTQTWLLIGAGVLGLVLVIFLARR